jgi:HEAT repeat protein
MTRVTKIATALILVLTFNLNFYAKNPVELNQLNTNKEKSKVSEASLKNYAKAIESENSGLKKSAVYMAGVYKINGLVKTLIKQFTKEKDDDVKVMIALALYMIGDERGIATVENQQ